LLVIQHGHDGEQLGLAAGFQSVVIGPTVFDDLFDDVAILVDLDRIDASVVALVAVLCDRGAKGLV
jgi:hypothetical protein